MNSSCTVATTLLPHSGGIYKNCLSIFHSKNLKRWRRGTYVECNLLVEQADPALECDVCMRCYHLNCNTGKCLLCVIDFTINIFLNNLHKLHIQLLFLYRHIEQ